MTTPSTTRTGYPKIPQSAWAKLRAKAASAPSTRFTSSAVAILLDLANAESARSNIVGPLQRLGLIDDNGALTDLGNKWRNDGTYGEACQQIIDAVYPAELAAFTDASGVPDRPQLISWFQQQNFGDSNARQMAATYAMIAEKRLPEANDREQRATSRVPRQRARSAAETVNGADASINGAVADPKAAPQQKRPDLYLAIQVHIPVDASADQIDQIFASMAKHLYSS